MSTKEVAELQHIAPATVKEHRENMRRKLGVQGKAVNLASYLAVLLEDAAGA